jgi:ubiquinone/menaquinone biosynthesis C-methylase UbiE
MSYTIQSIMTGANHAHRDRLVDVFFKHLKHHGCKPSEIRSVLRSSSSDNDTLKALRQLKLSQPPTMNELRAKLKAERIVGLLPPEFPTSVTKASCYLDVGAGDGVVGAKIGETLGFFRYNVFGVEIPERQDAVRGKRNVEITMAYLSANPAAKPNVAYHDELFSMITCLMSMHRFVHPKQMLSEVYRMLKPGGLLVIHEHDCDNEFMQYLIRMEHAVCATVIDDEDPAKFFQTLICKPTSAKETTEAITALGMQAGASTVDSKNNPTCAYWALFTKPA